MHRKTLWYFSHYSLLYLNIVTVQQYNITLLQYNNFTTKKNTPKPAAAAMRYYTICCNTRPVARKILQRRHYLKRCARIEFYKLLALYHADSYWSMRRFIYLFFIVALLGLLNAYAKNKPTYKNKKENRKFQPRQVPWFASHWLWYVGKNQQCLHQWTSSQWKNLPNTDW